MLQPGSLPRVWLRRPVQLPAQDHAHADVPSRVQDAARQPRPNPALPREFGNVFQLQQLLFRKLARPLERTLRTAKRRPDLVPHGVASKRRIFIHGRGAVAFVAPKAAVHKRDVSHREQLGIRAKPHRVEPSTRAVPLPHAGRKQPHHPRAPLRLRVRALAHDRRARHRDLQPVVHHARAVYKLPRHGRGFNHAHGLRLPIQARRLGPAHIRHGTQILALHSPHNKRVAPHYPAHRDHAGHAGGNHAGQGAHAVVCFDKQQSC